MEITGGTGDLGDMVSENITPFTTELIHKVMNNVIDVTASDAEVSAFYIAIDPTYSSGSLSSLGVCTFAIMKNGTMVVSFYWKFFIIISHT